MDAKRGEVDATPPCLSGRRDDERSAGVHPCGGGPFGLYVFPGLVRWSPTGPSHTRQGGGHDQRSWFAPGPRARPLPAKVIGERIEEPTCHSASREAFQRGTNRDHPPLLLPIPTLVPTPHFSLAVATVERVAISAVMAGCAPKHFRVVVAAVEAVSYD